MMGLEHIITLAVALVGSAGFWSFISMREKNKREASAEYQDTLKHQVSRLSDRLDQKTEQIEELLQEIGRLRADLSAAQVTINHLENLLRSK